MIYENTSRLYKHDDYPFACGFFELKENIEYHCHKEIEIIYVTNGQVTVQYGQDFYHLSSGDIFVIAPYVLHAFIDPKDDCTQYSFIYDFDIISTNSSGYDMDLSLKNLYRCLCPCSQQWPEDITLQVRELLVSLFSEGQERKPGWKWAVQALCSKFVLLCIRDIPGLDHPFIMESSEKLQKVIEYISDHFGEPFSEEKCARMMGMQPPSLSRFFKKNMGITIQEYLKRIRIEHARFLLRASDLTVTEVCFECGYTDLRTFNKMFKSLTSMSPSEYRRRNQDSDHVRSTYGRESLSASE